MADEELNGARRCSSGMGQSGVTKQRQDGIRREAEVQRQVSICQDEISLTKDAHLDYRKEAIQASLKSAQVYIFTKKIATQGKKCQQLFGIVVSLRTIQLRWPLSAHWRAKSRVMQRSLRTLSRRKTCHSHRSLQMPRPAYPLDRNSMICRKPDWRSSTQPGPLSTSRPDRKHGSNHRL